jgi:hypothetical protein
MDVKVMAFEITLGKGISPEALYNHCLETSDQAIQKRFLYIDQKDDWWRGLILTARNIKAFSRLIKEKGKLRLKPESLHNDELAHFNFFLLNTQSLCGYFQYYHGSSSIHSFGDTLKKKYRDLREIRLAEASKEAGIKGDYIPKHIKRKFEGYLKFEVILRKKSLQELMEELNYVKNITVQFKEYIPDQPLFRPLAEKAKSAKYRLTFGNHSKALMKDIIALGLADVIKDFRGVGVAEDNFDRPFKLINEPETLDHFDFNDVVLETEFDSGDIRKSIDNTPIVQRLYEIAERDGLADE